jgi:hypothetical protein
MGGISDYRKTLISLLFHEGVTFVGYASSQSLRFLFNSRRTVIAANALSANKKTGREAGNECPP